MSVSALQSAALLATLVNGPAAQSWTDGQGGSASGVLSAWPLLTEFGLARTAIGAIGQSSNAHALAKLYARITALLEGGNSSDCWAAMQAIKQVVHSAPSIADGSTAIVPEDGVPVSSALRPHADRWSKFLFRLLKQLLEPRTLAGSAAAATAAAPSTLPPLHPLLSLAAFETELALLTRVVNSWPDARREASNTTVPGLIPLLLKMISRSDTYAQQAQTGKGAQLSQQGSWPFPPPDALARSLAVLLGFLREFKTSLRPFGERIHAAVLPLLVHEDAEVRASAADTLASLALVQSGSAAAAAAAKKNAAAKAGSNGATDELDDAAVEEEVRAASLAAQAQSNRMVLPDDPWSTLLQQVLNTLHAYLDEMEDAGEGALGESDRSYLTLPRCSETLLALPALPSPANPSAAPFLRAHALYLQISGLFELVEALLSPDLFQSMAHAGGAAATVAVPVQALLALLRRIVNADLNPHTLLHITGKALPRTGLLLLRSALAEAPCNVLEALFHLSGPSLAPYVGQIGDLLREMQSRNAFVEAATSGRGDQRHPLPRLAARLYRLSAEVLRRFGPGALLYPFVLPSLSSALADAERLVRVKNLQLQLVRNVSSMHVFTGLTLHKSLSNKEVRRQSGGAAGAAATAGAATSGGKQSNEPEPSALFLESHPLELVSAVAVSALDFVLAALESCGAALPLQRRVQLDRSLASLVLAVQAGSWAVIDSYRLRLYECLQASLLTPASSSSTGPRTSGLPNAPASSSVLGGGSSTGAGGLLSSFSLLPYAVSLFTSAAKNDSSAQVRSFVSQALRLTAALTHPRALALYSNQGAFVQDSSLAPSDLLGAEDNVDSDSANRLASGLVRGRDGSLYMRMQEEQPEQQRSEQAENEEAVEDDEDDGKQILHEQGGDQPKSYSLTEVPAVSDTATSVVVSQNSRKRGREAESPDEPALMDESDDVDEAPAAKRAHVTPAAPLEQTTTLVAPTTTSSVDGAPVADAGNDVDDATGPTSAADEEDEDGPVAVLGDDGPDEGEGAQGSLWSL